MNEIVLFFYLIIYATSAYLVGRVLVQKVFLSSKYVITTSLILITGHVVITAAFAIIKTSGSTYLSIPLIVLLGLYFWSIILKGFELSSIRKEAFNWKLIGLTLIFISIAFLSMYFRIFDLNSDLKKIQDDYSFYGGVADFMGKYGIETLILDPLSISRTPYQPYHYFELWSASLLSSLSHTTGLKSLMLIVYPFHIFLLLFSIYELLKSSLNSAQNIMIFILITLFITPIGQILREAVNTFTPVKIPFTSENGIQTKMGMKLYAVQALFAIYLFYILRYKEWSFKLLIFLGVLMAIYPTNTPFGGVFLFMIWLSKSPQFISWITGNMKMLNYTIWILCLVLMSLSMATLGLKEMAIAFFFPFNYVMSFAYIMAVFIIPTYNRTTRMTIQLLLLLTFLHRLLIVGARYWFSVFRDANSNQIILNFADPAFLVLSIYIVLSFVLSKGKFVKFGAVVIVVFLYFGQGHQRAYMRGPMSTLTDKESLEILSNDPEALMAYERDSVDYERSTMAWSIYYDIPFHNLRWFTSNYFPICLTLPTVNFDTDMIDPARREWLSSIISKSSFYQFANSRDSSLYKSVDQKVDSFIQIHNIQKVIKSDLR